MTKKLIVFVLSAILLAGVIAGWVALPAKGQRRRQLRSSRRILTHHRLESNRRSAVLWSPWLPLMKARSRRAISPWEQRAGGREWLRRCRAGGRQQRLHSHPAGYPRCRRA